MQTSQSLRDQCLLTDIDFVTVRDGPDDDEWLNDDEDSAADGLDGHGGGASPSPQGNTSPLTHFHTLSLNLSLIHILTNPPSNTLTYPFTHLGSSRRSPHASFAPIAGTGTLIVSRPNRSMIIEGGDGRGGGILKYGQSSPLTTPSTALVPTGPLEVSSDQPPTVTIHEEEKDNDKKEKLEDVRGAARIRGMT